MSFNPDPTKQAVQILLSRKTHTSTHPKIYFNGTEVKSVNEHKHLGLTLDAKLTFASHIDEKLKKARQGLGMIKTRSCYFSVKIVEQKYKMYVRPDLEFCDIIYHVPCITNPFDLPINHNYLMNTLQMIQYHCAPVITGTWKGSGIIKIYAELGWEFLTDHRYCRRLSHRHGTWSEYVLHELNCNTVTHRGSFYPDSVRCWNKIGHLFRNSPNLKFFKTKL